MFVLSERYENHEGGNTKTQIKWILTYVPAA